MLISKPKTSRSYERLIDSISTDLPQKRRFMHNCSRPLTTPLLSLTLSLRFHEAVFACHVLLLYCCFTAICML